jgi:hypothetical protein
VSLRWAGNLKKMRVQPTAPATYWLAGFAPVSAGAGQQAAGGVTPGTGGLTAGGVTPGTGGLTAGGVTPLAEPERPLNDLLGREIAVSFAGRINCVACGREIKKAFGQGFCFPCSQSRAEADICMVKPELCHYFEPGHPCREEAWARHNCFQPHVLYVALTSGPKVGITRRINVPSRWLDQGAVAAMPLAELPNRREVGLLEHALARRFADRTHWMRMLKEREPAGDLPAFAAEVLEALAEETPTAPLPPSERVERRFSYPVLEYPEKVKSLGLDKMPEISGKLLGIKGQYLILDSGVINLRNHTGYAVDVRA